MVGGRSGRHRVVVVTMALVLVAGCTPLSNLVRVSLDAGGGQVSEQSTGSAISDGGRSMLRAE